MTTEIGFRVDPDGSHVIVLKGSDNAEHELSVNASGKMTLDHNEIWPQPTGDVMGTLWNADYAYTAGDVVSGSDFNIYVSLINDNVGIDPVTDGGVHWKLFGA